MWTAIAALLVGIWLVVESQGPASATLTLVFGIAVAVLALVELLPILRR